MAAVASDICESDGLAWDGQERSRVERELEGEFELWQVLVDTHFWAGHDDCLSVTGEAPPGVAAPGLSCVTESECIPEGEQCDDP